MCALCPVNISFNACSISVLLGAKESNLSQANAPFHAGCTLPPHPCPETCLSGRRGCAPRQNILDSQDLDNGPSLH